MSHVLRLASSALALALALAAPVPGAPQLRDPARRPAPDGRVPIVWLEASGPAARGEGELPVYRPIPLSDPRIRDADRCVDNEAASFMRALVARAWREFPPPPDWVPPRLAIVLADGGNTAETGFRLLANGRLEDHPKVPYVILDLDTKSLSNTLIHEGGHLLHTIATRGLRQDPSWSAIVHSTFAVTDPVTALAEGYAIHFETLWAHFGTQADMRAFYHRSSPAFDVTRGRQGEFFSPVADLMTFSQTWARYQAVRETWPAFAGHSYRGDYLRSQYDPARDRSTLKTPGGMVSSEGVAASVIFWTAAGLAGRSGAAVGAGLGQPSLLKAEETLLQALARMPAPTGFRPDVIDLVAAVGAPSSPERTLAISRFVGVTRGVTVRPEIRAIWSALYRSAVTLDFDAAGPLFSNLDAIRLDIVTAAVEDPETLRRGIGPVLPVEAPQVRLELKRLGRDFRLGFDINAADEVEWLAAGVDAATAAAIGRERDRAPFGSAADFEKRTGHSLQSLRLTAVAPR